MPRKIAISTLNANTIDILNTIRANASAQYQSNVPTVSVERDLVRVGDVLFGYPALANEFITALVNRIAAVRIKSATFNNPYVDLKKGFLEFGETVEEVFVQMAKAREFSAEKAEAREFKRTLPDVRSAFHCINLKIQYPITVQNNELRQAFLSFSGVEDMIAKIVDSVYRAAEYDEFLLFKYLLIKGVTHGHMYPIKAGATLTDSAVKFRGTSNSLQFIATKYNESGVHTNTPRADQYIFMSADFNAQFDVNVLASAFNMEKAEFMGKLKLIDDWTTFDNDRFSNIVEDTTQIEEVTDAELAIMANVQAILVDREWFQIYDNLSMMSEQFVASGLYWNYFYNIWKTVSYSPFSNAVVFVANAATTTLPDTITGTVTSKSTNGTEVTYSIAIDDSTAALVGYSAEFIQTSDAVSAGIAVHKYGAYVLPDSEATTKCTPVISVGGTLYEGGTDVDSTLDVGDEIEFTPQS